MKTKVILSLFILISLIYWALPGCKESTNPEESCSPFTGITERDENATIIGNSDPVDWKDSGILHNLMAYPNSYTSVCRIGFSLDSFSNIKITVNNSTNNVVRTLVDQPLEAAEWYSIRWDSKNDSHEEVPDCIYRIYFSATTNGNTYQTFGDVELRRTP